MSEEKNLKISAAAHRRLKIFCAEKGLPINYTASQMIEEWVKMQEAKENNGNHVSFDTPKRGK